MTEEFSMSTSNYLCQIVGECPKRVARFHPSSIKRLKAFAIAIHIPVLLWAVTGFVIASHIFLLRDAAAAAVAVLCAGLIYLVERVVLATPKVWYVNVSRVVVGVVISVLGASTVDLVIFDREVTQQLQVSGEERIRAEYDNTANTQRQVLVQKKADWLAAQDAANCEANGTCGSKVRSVGPVYRELSRQAEVLHLEYTAAQSELAHINSQRMQAVAQWRAKPDVVAQAGLLSRVEALHQYTQHNTAALVAWFLFFLLVLFFELMVVFAKLVFGDTVDDELDRIREHISQQKARAYMEAVTSPVASAKTLLLQSYA
jgi:Domain of unknown function (DUF4407)